MWVMIMRHNRPALVVAFCGRAKREHRFANPMPCFHRHRESRAYQQRGRKPSTFFFNNFMGSCIPIVGDYYVEKSFRSVAGVHMSPNYASIGRRASICTIHAYSNAKAGIHRGRGNCTLVGGCWNRFAVGSTTGSLVAACNRVFLWSCCDGAIVAHGQVVLRPVCSETRRF